MQCEGNRNIQPLPLCGRKVFPEVFRHASGDETEVSMKKMAGMVLIAFLAGAVPASGAETAVKKHYPDTVLQKGEKGIFTVEMMVPGTGLHMGVNTLELIVHDAQGKDVPDARITVVPWMPKMGHGVSEEPEVTERGGGAYTVDNVIFSMTGWWDLTVNVKKGELEDAAVFSFPEVTAMGHGRAMTAPKPEELDTTASVLSERGSFRLSYSTAAGEPPLNAIHSWVLEVKTSEGEPVTGAVITLVGDMPKHGHGLPTAPEVTEELGEGRYLVEGVKFSMPGWWVVTFHVFAGDKRESASFNLYLR